MKMVILLLSVLIGFSAHAQVLPEVFFEKSELKDFGAVTVIPVSEQRLGAVLSYSLENRKLICPYKNVPNCQTADRDYHEVLVDLVVIVSVVGCGGVRTAADVVVLMETQRDQNVIFHLKQKPLNFGCPAIPFPSRDIKISIPGVPVGQPLPDGSIEFYQKKFFIDDLELNLRPFAGVK